MFIGNANGGYTRDGAQWGRGSYLLLFSGSGVSIIDANGPPETRERVHCPDHGRDYPALYACVRVVALSQLGHWMMGRARVADSKVSVSGPYGHDGLPGDLDKLTHRARALLVRVPDAETLAYWHGGGHNSTGTEAPTLRQWARAHYKQLTRRGGRP